MHIAPGNSTPPLGALARIWAGIGLQSFGGGASTQLLIRRAFVEQHQWVEDDEFNRFWNLCQFTPGINLLALTVLIGRKLGGPWGIVVALAGLLLPSATITCVLAAGFVAVQHSVTVHAALRGVIPATAGIMALVAVNFSHPLVRTMRREGLPAILLGCALVLLGAVLLILVKLSVIVVVVGSALLGAALLTPRRARAQEAHIAVSEDLPQ